MADRSWLEFSDDDEAVDSEAARKIIEERLRKRKDEAERMSAPGLCRSMTANSMRYSGAEYKRSPKNASGRSAKGPTSCYGLLDTPSSGAPYSSTVEERRGPATAHSTQFPPFLKVQPVNLSQPTEPTYQLVDDDVTFAETFDIWFTDPSVISNRGTSKDMYDHACCYVGSFCKISEFYAFHNAIDWDTIPDGSVVAYTRKDIKPQWEDPMNAYGGRFMFKHFPRRNTERVFTKIALGFLSGLLTDWQHFNLVSLHIRSSSRGSDIQLWRRIPNGVSGFHAGVVMNDIKTLLRSETAEEEPDPLGNGAINWMPNSGSMQRNDHRINHFKQKRSGGLVSAHSLDSGIKFMQDDLFDAWSSGSSGYQPGALSDEMRKAMIAAADAELNKVTPSGVGLQLPEALTLPAAKSGKPAFDSIASALSDAPTLAVSAYSDGSPTSTVDSPISQPPRVTPSKTSYPLKRTQNVSGQTGKPRRFCFTQVADLLPSSSEASRTCSEAGTESDSPKQITKATWNRENPYPAYDAPISMRAWHKGQALKGQSGK